MTTTPTAVGEDRSKERVPVAAGLWLELARLTREVRGALEAWLDEEIGLSPEEADLLVLLENAPEQRLRMADVSAALRLSKSAVTRLVDRLSGRGLVVRAPCPDDRRVVYAGLTEDGAAAAGAAAAALTAGPAGPLAGRCSPEELERLTSALRLLATVREPGA